MIRSMTGFSRVQMLDGDLGVSVSVKTTNHRFLDVQVRVPNALEEVEPVLREMLKKRIARGHVEVSVSADHPGGPTIRLNRPLLKACLEAWRELTTELGASAQPDLGSLMGLPGVLSVDNGGWSESELAQLRTLAQKAMARALDQLNEMRTREGAALEADLIRHLEQIRSVTDKIARFSADAPEAIRQRLESRIRELAKAASPDPIRLSQEVAYLASRADISEELTRLASHLDQAKDLLHEQPEVGKTLDFLLQEMNREVNTLLAKSTEVPGAGIEISRLGIEIRGLIEKLREQAQNVE